MSTSDINNTDFFSSDCEMGLSGFKGSIKEHNTADDVILDLFLDSNFQNFDRSDNHGNKCFEYLKYRPYEDDCDASGDRKYIDNIMKGAFFTKFKHTNVDEIADFKALDKGNENCTHKKSKIRSSKDFTKTYVKKYSKADYIEKSKSLKIRKIKFNPISVIDTCIERMESEKNNTENKSINNTNASDDVLIIESELSSNPFSKHLSSSEKCKNNAHQNNHWTSEIRINTDNFSRSVPAAASNHLIDFWKDFDNGEVHSLPTLGAGRSDSIQRISVDVVKDLLTKKYNIDFLIVDCRYCYEYNGGHISNAINIDNTNDAVGLFKSPKAIIFHCEFSSKRAPKIAQFIRNYDRSQNVYPKLRLPEIYIMKGGYKEFFKSFPEYCVPSDYVPMDDARYKDMFIMEQKKRSFNN